MSNCSSINQAKQAFKHTPALLAALQAHIQQHALPATFITTLQNYYMPLAEQIYQQSQITGQTSVIGINGAQGTGKSTLSSFLKLILEQVYGCAVVQFSIDDLYHTHAKRQQLAREVHPLLQTRGVPGTHDVNLGIALLETLSTATASTKVFIPYFDKAIDDRAPREQWSLHQGKVDIILFEGWCVATPAQAESALKQALNALEANEDPHAIWRNYVNLQLQQSYLALFSPIEYLIMLKAPSFECIYQWRSLQEHKLAQKQDSRNHNLKIMNKNQLQRFIMHYERLTRFNLQVLPEQAQVVIELDDKHQITDLKYLQQ
ncbi:hypothetical protein [Candidatus Venteria ishoeyi]|uniref:Nucleoside triphosphate hydrolase domain-containing protein n=1 Tax=Candidatus Venteria ishoeyi TaxID=1899563 RepID=A0A1H6FA34_9GAMM|nr:hypothetical protein [Candidatus Venteria ishoeyi]SEH06970.1 nucleoside triphosphate hydrolase domain-containing protein [Candidatus Venteria ishoeyi]